MNNMPVLLSGAFGGIAPNLLFLGMSLTQGRGLPEASFLVGLMLFGAMGAIVTRIWGETELKRAFYLGLGLPALVQVGGNTIAGADMSASLAGAKFALISSAYAQENPIAGRTLTITTDGDASKNDYIVEFKSEQPGTVTTKKLSVPTSSPINVPPDAYTITIKKGNSVSNELKLSTTPNSSMSIKASLKKNTWSGLKQAFGVKNVAKYDLKIGVQ